MVKITREEFIEFLERNEKETSLFTDCYRKSENYDDVWKYIAPFVDGMMPEIRVLEDKVVYSQPTLYGDEIPDEEYSFEEMIQRIKRGE